MIFYVSDGSFDRFVNGLLFVVVVACLIAGGAWGVSEYFGIGGVYAVGDGAETVGEKIETIEEVEAKERRGSGVAKETDQNREKYVGKMGLSPIVDVLMGQLVVAEEKNVPEYSEVKGDYEKYSQGLREVLMVRGGERSIYTGLPFDYGKGRFDTDWSDAHIEHIVSKKEAHLSGLYKRTPEVREEFSKDVDNLTLAEAGNNMSKSSRDIAEWLPVKNRCWFVLTYINVKVKYELTIDREEENVLREQLGFCTNTFFDGRKDVEAY